MANTKIVLNRQSDLILDNALITKPQGIVLTDISGVSEAVASINSATSIAIDMEQSARVDGDQSLQNQIDFITNNTDAAALDSLTEIVAAFQSADGDLNGAISTLAGAAGSGLDAEISRAESVETQLSDANSSLNLEFRDTVGQDNKGTETDTRWSQYEGYLNGSSTYNKPDGSGQIDNTTFQNMFGPANLFNFTEFLAYHERLTSQQERQSLYEDYRDTVGQDNKGTETEIKWSQYEGYLNGSSTYNKPDGSGQLNNTSFQNMFGPANLFNFTEFTAYHERLTSQQERQSLYEDYRDTVGQDNKGTETNTKWSQYENYLNGSTNYNKPDGSGQLNNSSFNNMFGPANLFNFTEFLAYHERLLSEQERQSLYEDYRGTVGQDNKGTETDTKWSQYNDYVNGSSTYNKPDGSGQLDNSTFQNMFGPANLFNFTEFLAYDERLLSQQERQSLNNELQSQIDFITNNTDPAALDSLTEVVAAFQSADGDINNAITNLANAATVDLSAEVARAESAELSLDDAKLNLAGGTMNGSIDMGNQNIDGVNTITVNTSLYSPNDLIISTDSGRIWIPNSNFDLNDNGKVINLAAPTNNGDAANKAYVDGLSSTVSSDLSSEVVRAESAELSLATDFANIYAKHVAMSTTPDGSTTTFQLASSVREGSELVYLNGLVMTKTEITHYEGNQLVGAFYLAAKPLFPDVITVQIGDPSFQAQAASLSYWFNHSTFNDMIDNAAVPNGYSLANPPYGWTEVQWNDKKSQLQTLMGVYNVGYRAWNEVSEIDGLKPFIGYAADVVTVEGDYTTYVENGLVVTVTFGEAPSTGDKVKAYGVY